MQRYENFVGLTDVKAAQARVVNYEKKFIETQEIRREAQSKISEIQKKIKVLLCSFCLEPIANIKLLRIYIWSWRKLSEERIGTLS